MRNQLIPLIALTVMSMFVSCKDGAKRSNPLLSEWETPFGVPPFDKIKVADYKPAFEHAMSIQLEEVDAIVNNPEEPTFENVILALDNSGKLLDRISRVFGGIASADTNPELQKVQEQMSPVLSAHSDKISLNEKLFEKIKAVYDKRYDSELDSLQIRLTEKKYRIFERSGANLSPEDKDKLKKINEELATATFLFGKNLLADTKAFNLELEENDLTGIPKNFREAALKAGADMGKNGKYVFTLSKPSFLPFMTYAERRDLREQMYNGYYGRCNDGGANDNKEIINQIVNLRTRKAQLLGYNTHAELTLDNVMAKTPEHVYSLLDELWEPSLTRAKEDMAEMTEIMRNETGNSDFQAWDWWFYAEKLRKAKYNIDEEMVRPYLSLENVRSGIFYLSNRLYGVTFTPIQAPVYNPECEVYEVKDADNSHLGVLYMDFHPREGAKSVGAWCGTYRSSYYEDGQRVAPVVTIVCNFTRRAERTPALLTLDETETFFHEFGHALHNLFCNVPYRGLTGVERDFVELPSQIMENWAFEPELLKLYAFHYGTGKVITDEIIDKIVNSTHFNQGFMMTELIAASYSDLDIHNNPDLKPVDVTSFEIESLNIKRGLISQIAPRYRYPFFKHIFNGGYSSGYYSYIWSEVLDKDAFEAFVESGDIFNKEIAASFRENVLSKGGTADGMVLYKNFRGAEPSRLPLLYARGLKERPVKTEEIMFIPPDFPDDDDNYGSDETITPE